MRAVVTGIDQPQGAAISAHLRSAGHSVVGLPYARLDRAAHLTRIGGAIDSLGGLDALVISGTDAAARRPIALEDLTDDDFDAIWEGGEQAMLWSLQAAIPSLRESSGSAIVVVPTIGMTGGASYSATAALCEGQRILVKSASRQLAPEGVRINAIAVGSEFVLDDADAAEVHYLSPDTFGEPAVGDVTDAVDLLLSPAARKMTGQTLTIDGGRWLAP